MIQSLIILLHPKYIADSLEEVNVPIMKSCKSASDINGDEICAGEAAGNHFHFLLTNPHTARVCR